MWNKTCLHYHKSQWHAGYARRKINLECGRDICVVGETPSLIFGTITPSMPAKVAAIRSIRHFGLVFGKQLKRRAGDADKGSTWSETP